MTGLITYNRYTGKISDRGINMTQLHKHFLFAVLGTVVAILLAAGVARAEIIFLEDGRVLEGEIVSKTDDEVSIKTSSGATIIVEPWEITKTVKKEDILKEYEEKKEKLDEKDAKALYELAKWCKKHCLKEQYKELLKAALKVDPKHAEAKKELDLLEGKIELPEKPKAGKKKTKEGEKEKKTEKKKIFGNREKKKEKKKEGTYPFGTVTKDKRIPGDLDCKGDCRRLVQGGYMKFDLKSYQKGTTIKSASLKVYVKSTKKNPWLWVCQITVDPTKAPVKDVHAAIQGHKILISSAQKVQPGGWRTIRLSRKAVSAINEALARDKERWFALALTFE